MHVAGIGWVGVVAENFERALHFYSDVLGMWIDHRDETKVLALFRLPSGQLFELYGPSNRERKDKYRWFDGPALGMAVEDVGGAP